MEELKIHLDGDNCWRDLRDTRVWTGTISEAGYLDGGMSSGAPSVALRLDVDGSTSTMIAETSLRLFLAAAAAFVGKAKRDGVDCWRGPDAERLTAEEEALLDKIFGSVGHGAFVGPPEDFAAFMHREVRPLKAKILRQFVR